MSNPTNPNVSPTLLDAVRLAQLAGSARKIENAAAAGDLSDEQIANAVKIRAVLRSEQKPRVSAQSKSLDETAADLAAHINNSGGDAEFVVLSRYTEGKRRGEAQSVAFHNADKLSVTLTRGNAASVLEFVRTFYAAD